MASGAVSIGGDIAVKQMDEGAGDAFMLTGLGVTRFKAVKHLMRIAKGKTTRRRRRRSYRRSLGDDEFDLAVLKLTDEREKNQETPLKIS